MNLSHFFIAILTVFIWGLNYISAYYALEGMSPWMLAATRFFLTSMPLIFFIKRPQAHLGKVFLYGLTMCALLSATLFYGIERGLAPGLSSILLQVQVVFTTLLAITFFKERITPWQIIGGSIAMLGMFMIGIILEGESSLSGFIFLIIAALMWAFGNAILKWIGKVDIIALVIWGSFFAWPLLFALALYFDGIEKIVFDMTHLSWTALGGAFFTTYFATLVGFSLWGWLLARYPLVLMAPFTLLIPVFGMLSSFLLLGEVLSPYKMLASFCIVVGFATIVLGPWFQSYQKA